MTSVLQAAGVGIEPTASWFRARRHCQQQLPRNVRQTKTAIADQGSRFRVLRPGIAPDLRASKAHAATTRRRECPAGVEPASPGWKTGAFAARPRAHVVSSGRRGSRTLKAREARPGSSGVPSPVGLPFRKAAVAGIEPASGRVTTACPYQHEHHRINHSVRMVGFEPTISCSQGTRDARLPHILNIESAQRESNPHIRHGKAVGCRYIMGACWLPSCQRSGTS